MRLTQRGFLISAAILIALNLFVYLWWMNRPMVVMAPAQMNREIVAGLQTESQRLQLILDGNCESPELQAFRRGEIGPLLRQEQGSPSGVPPQVLGQRPGATNTPALSRRLRAFPTQRVKSSWTPQSRWSTGMKITA